MYTVFTAIGQLKAHKNNSTNNIYYVVIKNGQEYGLSKQELILWTLLAGTFPTYDEAQKEFYLSLCDYHLTPELDFDHYLKRLSFRGLIASSTSYTQTTALCDLIKNMTLKPSKTNMLPLSEQNSFLQSLKGLLHRPTLTAEEYKLLKKIRNTPTDAKYLLSVPQLQKRMLAAITSLYEKKLLFFDCI